MRDRVSALHQIRLRLQSGAVTPFEVAQTAQAQADQSEAAKGPGCGTYILRDAAQTIAYAKTLPERFPNVETRPLMYGVPVSIKDCFDLAGTVTGCGSRFYAGEHGPAIENAWIVDRLVAAGAVVMGKTHLHQLAYGITGENEDYGNSQQPRDRRLLTGGSSSGAVASIQEESAIVAVGTDTGGSIRVPAALCGMAGYRASHGLFPDDVCWRGGAHLAVSFDTLGLLFEDLRDGPLLGEAVFALRQVAAPAAVRIGFVGDEFLHDCDAEVLAAYVAWKQRLREQGAVLRYFETAFWNESKDIFMPIQAHEAATLHRGRFDHFEDAIAERLRWGASISPDEVAALRRRHLVFCEKMEALFENFDFLVLPCAPVSRLVSGEDQSGARARILRYTAPISLAGLPTVTLSGEVLGNFFGTGMQLVAIKGNDAQLLAFAAAL